MRTWIVMMCILVGFKYFPDVPQVEGDVLTFMAWLFVFGLGLSFIQDIKEIVKK